MDGIHGSDDANMLMHYEHHAPSPPPPPPPHAHAHHDGMHHDGIMSTGNGMNHGEEQQHNSSSDGHVGEGADGGGRSDHEMVQADVVADHGMLDHGVENGDQLTLSFQGQVYVFDSVSPEKVQAVLLLLGGREVPPTAPATSSTSNHSNRAVTGTPQRFTVPQRLASLIRFREKRKERNFDKKIRYAVRKEVALRMQRNKGQFTSSKSNHDDSASAVTSWESNESWGSDTSGSQHLEAVCRHCGVSEKSTPMMRRGPEGPRTLCNACGLMWANKGTLRDLSNVASHSGHRASFVNRNAEHSLQNGNVPRIAGNGTESS